MDYAAHVRVRRNTVIAGRNVYPHYYGVHESAQGSVRYSVVATLHHCTAPGRGMAACASAIVWRTCCAGAAFKVCNQFFKTAK